MDTICLKAAADSVYRLAKRIASRMGFDKDPDKVETAASKKEKDQQVKGLSRNFAKVSHANPIIVAEYLVSYVSHCRGLLMLLRSLPSLSVVVHVLVW